MFGLLGLNFRPLKLAGEDLEWLLLNFWGLTWLGFWGLLGLGLRGLGLFPDSPDALNLDLSRILLWIEFWILDSAEPFLRLLALFLVEPFRFVRLLSPWVFSLQIWSSWNAFPLLFLVRPIWLSIDILPWFPYFPAFIRFSHFWILALFFFLPHTLSDSLPLSYGHLSL